MIDSLNTWQRELLESKARYRFVRMPRRSDKTTAIAACAVNEMLFHPKSRVMYFTDSKARANYFHEVAREIIKELGFYNHVIYDLMIPYNDLELGKPLGSRLRCFHNKEGLCGQGADLIIVEPVKSIEDKHTRSLIMRDAICTPPDRRFGMIFIQEQNIEEPPYWAIQHVMVNRDKWEFFPPSFAGDYK